MDILSFVIGILSSCMSGPGMVVGVIKHICRLRFRGILSVLGLLILFEVEYCLAANSVRCRMCECFVVFRRFIG